MQSGWPSFTGTSRSSAADGNANGYTVVARALAHLGIRFMYGVIGIPVTELASAAQVYLLPARKALCPCPLILICRLVLTRMGSCPAEDPVCHHLCCSLSLHSAVLHCCAACGIGHLFGYTLPLRALCGSSPCVSSRPSFSRNVVEWFGEISGDQGEILDVTSCFPCILLVPHQWYVIRWIHGMLVLALIGPMV